MNPVIFQLPLDRATVEQFPWGTLRWLCNDQLAPGTKQTLGMCEISPGCRNPVHFHPNCEELLHMISGRGEHSYDEQKLVLEAGSTIRIPAGVKHNLANIGDEPIVCLIAFSSGCRETIFLSQ